MNNIEEYQNLVQVLKMALEFYANKENYVHPSHNNSLFSPIEMDCGAQAKFALENIKRVEDNRNELEQQFVNEVSKAIESNTEISDVLKIIDDFKNSVENDKDIQ